MNPFHVAGLGGVAPIGAGPNVLVATTAIAAHTLNATEPVRGLVASGAHVLWSITPAFSAHATRHGATVLPAPPAARSPRNSSPVGGSETHGAVRGLLRVRGMYRDDLAGPVAAQVHHLMALIEEHQIDVLLSDTLMFAAGIAAEIAGCAWVTFGDGPLAWPDPAVPPLGTGLWLMGGPAGRHRNRTVKHWSDQLLFAPGLERLNQVRTGNGLWPVPELPTAGISPQMHLHGCAASFEYPRSWWPPHLRFVGALGPGPRYGDRLPRHLRERDDRPLAVVTQGTLRPRSEELVDAACAGLRREGFRVVVAGRSRPAQQRGGVDWVEMLDLADAFAHADLLVTNGGWTTVTLAAAAGVGVVQCGATEEKPDIGARVQHAGVGRSIRLTHPPARLVGRVAAQVFASPQRRAASAAMAHEFSQLDAASLSAQAIFEVAGTAVGTR